MILLIGATGITGSEIAKQLAGAGVKTRAMVRNSKKAEGLKQFGIEVVEGDATQPETLQKALEGAEKLVFSTNMDERQAELHKNIIDAARSAGVQQALRISAMGSDLRSPIRIGKTHGQSDSDLKQSGIPYTILQPAYFMQNFFLSIGDIAERDAFSLPIDGAKLSLVDVRDIGAVAVRTLTEDGHTGKTYEITGPAALSGAEMADMLSLALGKRVKFEAADPDEFRNRMIGSGFPEWTVDALAELYAVFASGFAARITDTVEKVTGKPPISFDRFAKDYAQVFLQHAASGERAA
jgi:uncharacterized protein YbjT (DUF2867 family)